MSDLSVANVGVSSNNRQEILKKVREENQKASESREQKVKILGWLTKGAEVVRDAASIVDPLLWPISLVACGKKPCEIEWKKEFGSEDVSEIPNYIQQTNDGGYILVGYKFGSGEEYNPSKNYLVKVDSDGNVEWDYTYTSTTSDSYSGELYSVQQTDDGGYITTGSYYQGGDQDQDFILIKLDLNGNKEWDQRFGNPQYEIARSVFQIDDGGYIVIGQRSSDIWIIKTTSEGNLEWDQEYSSEDYSRDVYSAQQTSDGGYIVIGSACERFEEDRSHDFYLAKINADYNLEWDQRYGSNDYHEFAYSGQQTSEDGYILAGDFHDTRIVTDDSAYCSDIMLVKTDSRGDEEWNKIYKLDKISSYFNETAFSIQQTNDKGYIVAGGGHYEFTICPAFFSFLLGIDQHGNKEWEFNFGEEECRDNEIRTMQKGDDGKYITAGYIVNNNSQIQHCDCGGGTSENSDMNYSDENFWLVKISCQ